MLLLFFVFAFLGHLVNALVPSAWVRSAFGNGAHWGVPLAAVLGLPFYVNTEASLPMVRAFIDNGASAGAALAFLITGAGTSLGAIAGALSIARWRVVVLVVSTLWVGAVAFGVAYDMATPASVRMKPIAKVEPTTVIEQDLKFLTGAQTAGRLSGSEGAGRAARYLAAARTLARGLPEDLSRIGARSVPAAAKTTVPTPHVAHTTTKGDSTMKSTPRNVLVQLVQRSVGLTAGSQGCCGPRPASGSDVAGASSAAAPSSDRGHLPYGERSAALKVSWNVTL